MSNKRPGLAEVQCSRLRFQAGDRILVRTYHKLTADEARKLRKTITKWAGEEVEILIIDATQMELQVDPRAHRPS